jgi:hypothetical protein
LEWRLGLGGAMLVKMVGAEILISMQLIVLAFSVRLRVWVYFLDITLQVKQLSFIRLKP